MTMDCNTANVKMWKVHWKIELKVNSYCGCSDIFFVYFLLSAVIYCFIIIIVIIIMTATIIVVIALVYNCIYLGYFLMTTYSIVSIFANIGDLVLQFIIRNLLF